MAYIGTTKIFAGLKGDGVIIRFSANADGSDFTSEWTEGQRYIGFATGKENNPPTDKATYKWAKFALSDLDNASIASVDDIYELFTTEILSITFSGDEVLSFSGGDEVLATQGENNRSVHFSADVDLGVVFADAFWGNNSIYADYIASVCENDENAVIEFYEFDKYDCGVDLSALTSSGQAAICREQGRLLGKARYNG